MNYKMFHSDLKYTDNWIEFSTNSLKKYLENFVWKEYKIYDADTCGEDEIEFVIIDDEGKSSFYKFEYSWYFDYRPDWELIDSVSYEKLNSVSFKYPSKNRDWLKI